jgi:hypothetical protein
MTKRLFFLAALIPAIAMGQTTEERLSELEARVNALELVSALTKAQKAESPTSIPSSAKDSPIELIDWDFGYEMGTYNQALYKITYTVPNVSDKEITANHSDIYFLDLLGETVTSIRIGADIQLPPSKAVTDTRYYDINQFMPAQLRLGGMAKENIKAVLIVAKAAFADGSVYKAPK